MLDRVMPGDDSSKVHALMVVGATLCVCTLIVSTAAYQITTLFCPPSPHQTTTITTR